MKNKELKAEGILFDNEPELIISYYCEKYTFGQLISYLLKSNKYNTGDNNNNLKYEFLVKQKKRNLAELLFYKRQNYIKSKKNT